MHSLATIESRNMNIFARLANIVANAATSINTAEGKINQFESLAVNEIETVANGEADYAAGKPVVLGPVSDQGQAGHIVAVMIGGEASKALGLG